jgi:hypothetical protein
MTATELHPAQRRRDTHGLPGGVDLLASTDQGLPVTHGASVGAGDPSPVLPSILRTPPIRRSAGEPEMLPWRELRLACEIAEDIAEQEGALDNRIRASAVTKATEKHLVRMAAALHQAKLAADLNRRDTYRAVVPKAIREWQEYTAGIGDEGLPRLLGHIGHPAWKWVHEAQGETRDAILVDSSHRTFGQLIAYCGLVPCRRRHKGMTADDAQGLGRRRVGPIIHMIADSAGIKNRDSIYRGWYDDARTFYDTQDIAPGHAMNRALRIVKREILRDLWTVACQDLIPPSPNAGSDNPMSPAVTVG